ncbi:MAG: NYN domain-containing protein [Candidatus Aenigmarchaeota archaeon]|nr:NYN domain-containing protein [Candidatus Aenigmarchaeota archaeon]
MDKAAIFLDGGYFAKVLKNFGEVKVDFSKFSEILCKNADSERFRTYYYYCLPYQSNPPTSEESKRYSDANRFISSLKKLPRFEIRLGKLSYQSGQFIQKRVDNLMTVDIIKLSATGHIQKAIIVSGDSDLVPAVNEAKDIGVITQIYYFQGTIHDELFTLCDDRFEITKELIESCTRIAQV